MFLYLFTALFSAEVASAFHSFQPNCTTPPDYANFTFNPQIRGTMTIIWGALAVLLLCTWSVQHLCVPINEEIITGPEAKDDVEAKNDRNDKNTSWNKAFRRKCQFLIDKIIWMGT